MQSRLTLGAVIVAATVAGCTTAPQPSPASAKYVAMGSSFAAGPGIQPYADASPAPCYRSLNNYAHQLANRKGLALTDVSCSGATTAHLTGTRGAIPPQLDAVTPDTRLVTITIGGNDLGYIGSLTGASCRGLAEQTGTASDDCSPMLAPPADKTYADLAARMNTIAQEVRRRAPSARLVFVDYLAVLPETGVCAATPLSAQEADFARANAKVLAAITAKAAADNGADVVKASALSKGHDACSADPWMNGYPRPEAPVAGTLYHPNAKGMTAVAEALEKLLAP